MVRVWNTPRHHRDPARRGPSRTGHFRLISSAPVGVVLVSAVHPDGMSTGAGVMVARIGSATSRPPPGRSEAHVRPGRSGTRCLPAGGSC